MKVKEVASIVGISIRTLHHYDEIGLLTPDTTTEAGYRVYSNDNLETLQQILFFKEMGFSLQKIKEIIHSPTFNRLDALELHRKMLVEKRNRLDTMIDTVNKTIQHMKGECNMSSKEKFEGFDFKHNPYEQEAREKWGDRAVDESKAKIGKLSQGEQSNLEEEFDAIYKKLAKHRHEHPESDIAQLAIEDWYVYLNRIGNYSLDAFKGLGDMYVEDERFTKNIDKYGEGLALFMRDAMAVFADTRKE